MSWRVASLGLTAAALISANASASVQFSPLHEWCIRAAASTYYRPSDPISFNGLVDLIHATMAVEGGCGVDHINANLSHDYGCMQINDTHLPLLRSYGINAATLQYNDCQNIMIGTWVLASELKSGRDLWTSIGNYNSRTPKYNRAYQARIWLRLQQLWASRIRSR